MQPCMYPTRSARIALARSIFPNGQRIGVQTYRFDRRTIRTGLTTVLPKTQIDPADNIRLPQHGRSKFVKNGTPEEAATSTVDADILPGLYKRPVYPGSLTLRYSLLSGRKAKTRGLPPTLALANWMDANLGGISSAQAQAIESWIGEARPKSLPMVLIKYLEKIKQSRISPNKELAFPLDNEELLIIKAKGYEAEDIAAWAYVLFTVDSEVAAKRFMTYDRAMPTFVLLELLRREDITQQTLKKLLACCWDVLLGRPRPNSSAIVESKTEQAMTLGTYPLEPNVDGDLKPLEENEFMVMVSRLLRHARRTWPTAVISIAKMGSVYLHMLQDIGRSHRTSSRLQRRLTRIYNVMITRLALPSRSFPLKSMHFNWQAQRFLLTIAGDFQPALEIDQPTYRAVMSVLVASKKSENEINFVRNVARSWPPWRTEQDGIDAVRSIESDLSRTVGAIQQMRGAGYLEGSVDQAIGILGGREPDGTPTIQNRYIVPARLRRKNLNSQLDTYVWISRIRATRDVKEAWSAFLGFEEEHPEGSMGVYYAMFEKLVFDKVRHLHSNSYRTLPGNGKEVMEVADENLSVDEKIRLTPPDFDLLYQRMIQQNIRPSGGCLFFLISHARTIESGIQYIKDSDMSQKWKDALITNDPSVRQAHLKSVTDRVFLAFIKLLCRFAYCVETPPPHESDEVEKSGMQEGSVLSKPFRPRRDHPLLQAVTLISERNPKSRPPWYTLFKTLAKKGVIVDLSPIGMAENDILSWKTLKAALRDSQAAGIELDSKGYRILCIGFRKALRAAQHLGEEQMSELNDSPALLKELFAGVKEDIPAENGIPALVHIVEAVTIHTHICVMGDLGDTEEILNVLQWMVNNQRELEAIDAMSSNGLRMKRRCLVATRSYLEGDEEAKDRARELIESVKIWDGWPTDEEVYAYRNFQ